MSRGAVSSLAVLGVAVVVVWQAACHAPKPSPPDADLTPPTRLSGIVATAAKNGFLLQDQVGRTATIEPFTPGKDWSFGPPPRIGWRVSLSDARFSDVVDVSEWQYADADTAGRALPFFQHPTGEAEMRLRTAWTEGAALLCVETRAVEFASDQRALVSLIGGPAAPSPASAPTSAPVPH
jgi:hypothetical protein